MLAGFTSQKERISFQLLSKSGLQLISDTLHNLLVLLVFLWTKTSLFAESGFLKGGDAAASPREGSGEEE